MAVYVFAAVWLIHQYSVEVNAFDRTALRLTIHEQVASGVALDPYRYRVLAPVAIKALQTLGLVPDDPVSLDRSYFIMFGACFVLTFLVVRLMLSAYGWTPAVSLVGPLLMMVVLPVSFRYHDFQPWSWIEMLSVPLAITLLIRRRRIVWYLLVVLLASLNRETALVLSVVPLALLAARPRGHRSDGYLVWAAGVSCAIWIVVRTSMVLVIPGPAPARVIEVADVWERNLSPESPFAFLFTVAVFAGPVAVAGLVGALSGRVPRQALWIAAFTLPLYFGGYLVFALWIEVRVLLPAVIVLLPLAMAAFAAPKSEEH